MQINSEDTFLYADSSLSLHPCSSLSLCDEWKRSNVTWPGGTLLCAFVYVVVHVWTYLYEANFIGLHIQPANTQSNRYTEMHTQFRVGRGWLIYKTHQQLLTTCTLCVTKASVANQSLTTDPELWTLVKEINLLDMKWRSGEWRWKEGGGEYRYIFVLFSCAFTFSRECWFCYLVDKVIHFSEIAL